MGYWLHSSFCSHLQVCTKASNHSGSLALLLDLLVDELSL
jgi:hypothetical protein